jgi:alpha-L-fucosidase
VAEAGEFTTRRFGLFVHWGVYSLAARNEWMRHRERTPDEEYQRYFRHFDPDLYDPREWAGLACDAGMRYAVITTKHHDGFCLWDSELTEFKAGRDLLAPFVTALRERDMGVGLYHSLIDWHHPHFPLDGLHPLRDDPQALSSAGQRDIAVYRRYLHGQVRELLTRYGPIDEMWLDFSYVDHVHEGKKVWGGKGADDWGSVELLAMIRRLQPGILVNDRTGLPGDFVTPEQYQPSGPMTRDGRPVLWEACQTLNGSWGYDRENRDFKSVGLLLRMLVDTVAKDGNLLLNVGPTARGEFDEAAVQTLRGIGRWMRRHARSIHGAGRSEFTPPPDCRYTQRGDRLYLHLFAWPFDAVHLPGLAGRVEYAQFLHDASEIRQEAPGDATGSGGGSGDVPGGGPGGGSGGGPATGYATTPAGQPPGTLTLLLPTRPPDVEIPVIELFLR